LALLVATWFRVFRAKFSGDRITSRFDVSPD